MNITAIILTMNEEIHIERAIKSLNGVCNNIFVIDSGSDDQTQEISRSLGATVLERPFKNQAEQFNWALSQLPKDTDWVLRIDADEFLSSALRNSIIEHQNISPDVTGIFLRRRIWFMGQPIRFGGLFPMPILRLFKFGTAHSEERWMDEHIVTSGKTLVLEGELVDNNLQSIDWWISKHNRYASREAIQTLIEECPDYCSPRPVADKRSALTIKRRIKYIIFDKAPIGFGPFIYFFYRYFLRGGFRDGAHGFAFHFLQGMWYRTLVQIKCREANKLIQSGQLRLEDVINKLFSVKI